MRFVNFMSTAGLSVFASAVSLACAGSSQAQIHLLSDGPQIELRDMVARIVVMPEDRSDIDIRVRYGKVHVPTLMVSHHGNVTVLNGHLSNPNKNFGFKFRIDINDTDNGEVDKGTVFISGLGNVNIGDLPLVFVRVPQNAVVKDSAYSFGQVKPSKSLDFIMNGNGDWQIEPVSGSLSVIDSGSGTLHVSSAGDSIIDSMGSGDIDIGSARNLRISLSGSGGFSSGQSLDTELQNSGSGDVNLGRVRNLRAQLNGSGDLTLATVGGISVVNNGTSDVRIARANGPVNLDLSGSGDINIQGGQIPTFVLKGSGSGDVNYGGIAGTVNIDSNGSGDVKILKATGNVVTKVVGSGDMHIGH